MTAKEMFEEQNYKLIIDEKSKGISNWEIIYELETPIFEQRTVQIKFLSSKCCYIQLIEDGKIIGGASVSPSLVIAINQQMEDLGWLDE